MHSEATRQPERTLSRYCVALEQTYNRIISLAFENFRMSDLFIGWSLSTYFLTMCDWLHQDNRKSRTFSVASETARGMKSVLKLNPAIRGEIAPLAMSNRSQFCTRPVLVARESSFASGLCVEMSFAHDQVWVFASSERGL